jgi:hypothetical protein
LNTRKSVRPYTTRGEFSFNEQRAVYQTVIVTSNDEFFTSSSDCLETGAHGELLGYVIGPGEADAYRSAFGGTLEPIVTCAARSTIRRGHYGDRDYLRDAEGCSRPVFAGFTVGVTVQQSVQQGLRSAHYGRRAADDEITSRPFDLVATGPTGSVELRSPLEDARWQVSDLAPLGLRVAEAAGASGRRPAAP